VLAIRLVVFGLTSLRGACRVANVFSPWVKSKFPCHVAVQNWVMRFGLHRLTRPLEHRSDWVYIIDYTIDFGAKKCLVILGISLESFRNCSCRPAHQDMEVVSVEIHEKACAANVLEALQNASSRTGAPVQIVSDHGADIRKGVKLFTRENQRTKYTYDITHRTALLLKHQLKEDPNWQQLVLQACATKRAVLHTDLAFLAPPKPRDKARWLNLDSHLNWAENVLAFTQQQKKSKSDADVVDWEKFEKKFGWLLEFKPYLREWRKMLDLLQAAKDEIKQNGLRMNSVEKYEKATHEISLHTQRLRYLRREVMEHLRVESAIIADEGQLNPPWLGSSDIIESVFGKYKNFAARTPMKEVGKAVLTMPVFTSDITEHEVKEAMGRVSTEDLREWLDKNVGDTLFAKRKRALGCRRTTKRVNKCSQNSRETVHF